MEHYHISMRKECTCTQRARRGELGSGKGCNQGCAHNVELHSPTNSRKGEREGVNKIAGFDPLLSMHELSVKSSAVIPTLNPSANHCHQAANVWDLLRTKCSLSNPNLSGRIRGCSAFERTLVTLHYRQPAGMSAGSTAHR
jgi:hypothetical protein